MIHTKQKDFYNKGYLNGYRENLRGYEFARWHALDHLIQKVLQLNDVYRVLDYGCGNGLHVDLWKKVFPVADLYFCDISSVAIEKLKRKYPEFVSKCAEVNDNNRKCVLVII